MSVAAFLDYPPLVAALSFFVCLGYMSLNETAREIEDPFGVGGNRLPMVKHQTALDSKLRRVFDLWQPDHGHVHSRTLRPTARGARALQSPGGTAAADAHSAAATPVAIGPDTC